MNFLIAGWQTLVDYLTLSRILSLTIAFFLSGAIATFMSQGAVLKYFGPQAKKGQSFFIASVSGVILAVCSCSVLPLFASIRKKGAGLGPAVTFLFSGPAINILAITMTFSLIGVSIGMVRVIGAILLGLVLGLILHFLFQRQEKVDENAKLFVSTEKSGRRLWQNLLFFITLIAILLSGVRNPVPTVVLALLLLGQLIKFFHREELLEWVKETLQLALKIAPLFIAGIFAAGVFEALIPPEYMVRYLGNNSYSANLLAAGFAAFMYFATLTEVPIVNSFMGLGMLPGPATALLLAGPTLSLPNMIVVSRVLGLKRTTVYVMLVIALSSLIGMFAGIIIHR